MLVPFTKMVITYRPKGSFSFGSLPDAGPKRRHHSTQYAVREMIPISERSGIRALISCSRAFAAAHSTSSRLGAKNRRSSCAVISRLNRGYAVLSIEVKAHPAPDESQRHHQRHWVVPHLELRRS